MKKLFLLLAVAGTLTACNEAGDSTANAKDSLDSIAGEKKEAVDSVTEQKKETLDRMDSLNKADTANRKK